MLPGDTDRGWARWEGRARSWRQRAGLLTAPRALTPPIVSSVLWPWMLWMPLRRNLGVRPALCVSLAPGRPKAFGRPPTAGACQPGMKRRMGIALIENGERATRGL